MERELEKVKEREKQKEEESVRVKLMKRGILVGKRGGTGTSTPPRTWRYGVVQSDGTLLGDFSFPSNNTTLSARQLASNLWEIHPHHHHNKFLKMTQSDLKLHHHKPISTDQFPTKLVAGESPHHTPFEEPTNEDSLEKHIAESVKQDHHPDGRNGYNPEPSSVASYSSSMEMAPYNPSIAPTNSVKMKGSFGESSYSLKTSAELLKVLNRIWTLEEQHVSNASLVKELKKELDYSRTRIKELLQEKQRDEQEIDYLKKKMAQIRVSERSREQDQMKSVLRSLQDEVGDETKLRKHSESLHRKLAREVVQINSSFSDAMKELERERTGLILLEELCDEFALGIIDYEQEVRFLLQKKKDGLVGREHCDKLILHLSEAWLDGRMQIKQAELSSDLVEKKSVYEKLRCEIETFLQSQCSGVFRNKKHRHSLERFPLNKATSAPRRDEPHPTCWDYNDVELIGVASNNQTNTIPKPFSAKKKIPSIEVLKEEDESEKVEVGFERPGEEGCSSQKADIDEVKQEVKDKEIDKHLNERVKLYRMKSFPGEDEKQVQDVKIYVEEMFDPSTFTGPTSPVEKWTSSATAVAAPNPQVPDEPTSNQTRTVKENTLRAKLLEARLESKARTSKVDQAKG